MIPDLLVLELLRTGRQRMRIRDFSDPESDRPFHHRLVHRAFASAGLVRRPDAVWVPGPTTYAALERYIACRLAFPSLLAALDQQQVMARAA
jgi:hypothetical protein